MLGDDACHGTDYERTITRAMTPTFSSMRESRFGTMCPDSLYEVYSFLPAESVYNLSLVNKHWYRTMNENDFVWQRMFNKADRRVKNVAYTRSEFVHFCIYLANEKRVLEEELRQVERRKRIWGSAMRYAPRMILLLFIFIWVIHTIISLILYVTIGVFHRAKTSRVFILACVAVVSDLLTILTFRLR
jgi:hypothetical protein